MVMQKSIKYVSKLLNLQLGLRQKLQERGCTCSVKKGSWKFTVVVLKICFKFSQENLQAILREFKPC